MAISALELNIDQKQVVSALQTAGEKLNGDGGEVVLDFSGVKRLDSNAVQALEEFVGLAEGKAFKPTIRGINVDVYKVLKLVKLTSRLSFVSETNGHWSAKSENFHAEQSAK